MTEIEAERQSQGDEEMVDFDEEVETKSFKEEEEKVSGKEEKVKDAVENSGSVNLKGTSRVHTPILSRDQTCPTGVRIVLLKNGKQLKWQDYASFKSKGSIEESEDVALIDLYAWPDTSLEELGYLIAKKMPSFFSNPSLKLVFKAVHADRLVQQELDRSQSSKSSISDLGFLFLNKHSSDSSSILFKSKYSLGDILEVSVMSRADSVRSGRSDLRTSLKSSSSRFAPYSTIRRKK